MSISRYPDLEDILPTLEAVAAYQEQQLDLVVDAYKDIAKAAGIEREQAQTLMQIATCPEICSADWLATRRHVKRNTMVSMIDRLQSQGLVTRHRLFDKRVEIRLTKEGQDAIKVLFARYLKEYPEVLPKLQMSISSILDAIADFRRKVQFS